MVETERLVKKAIEGSPDAFGELYSGFAEKIYRYVFYNIRDRVSSEDITQEVFLKAWKAIGSCKGKEKTFSPWLYRIAHNLLVDKYRKKKYLLLEAHPVENISDTEYRIHDRLDQEDLINSLEFLPANQRQLIILKFIEGMDNREIAGIMKKSEGAIRIMQMRALSRLKDTIEKDNPVQ
ncbi:MAG: sigma-70 family RNA polymerase sigma factor [Dehalococcoidales bacterium]|nr:sigma-70 family RNA polymerase sigma factor [Dehalococcoidales bacterium]